MKDPSTPLGYTSMLVKDARGMVREQITYGLLHSTAGELVIARAPRWYRPMDLVTGAVSLGALGLQAFSVSISPIVAALTYVALPALFVWMPIRTALLSAHGRRPLPASGLPDLCRRGRASSIPLGGTSLDRTPEFFTSRLLRRGAPKDFTELRRGGSRILLLLSREQLERIELLMRSAQDVRRGET